MLDSYGVGGSVTDQRRALVTGASGFIGSNLVPVLQELGDEVLGLDITAPRNPAVAGVLEQCDIRDAAELGKRVRDFAPDVIYHLAARTDLHGTTVADYDANTVGVTALLDVIAGLPNQPVLAHASSRLVFAIDYRPKSDWDYHPSTAYGESKIAGEDILRSSGLSNWFIFRPTSLWGPWFDVPYRNFFETIKRGVYLHPKGSNPRKSFGYVENGVHELISLAGREPGADAGPFWLADYEPYDVRAWASEIQRELQAPKLRVAPVPLLKAAALAGDAMAKLKVPFPLTSFRLANLMTDMVYDMSRTEQAVGALPVSRVEGVRRTVAWLREHPRS